jgi:hypothetical protein
MSPPLDISAVPFLPKTVNPTADEGPEIWNAPVANWYQTTHSESESERERERERESQILEWW